MVAGNYERKKNKKKTATAGDENNYHYHVKPFQFAQAKNEKIALSNTARPSLQPSPLQKQYLKMLQ